MGLFGISKILQYGVCNHDEPRASPPQQGEEGSYRREKEVGRAIVNKESIGGIENSRYSGFSLAEL